MEEKTKKRILFIILCFFTLLILFIVLRLNSNRKIDMLSNSVIKGYLSEIKYEEIQNYVKEQPNTVIYVSNSSEDESIEFEKKLKYVIKTYNLENEIIYININETTIVDPVYQNAPVLVFYQNGEISDIMDCNILNTKEDIVNKLKERSVIND